MAPSSFLVLLVVLSFLPPVTQSLLTVSSPQGVPSLMMQEPSPVLQHSHFLEQRLAHSRRSTKPNDWDAHAIAPHVPRPGSKDPISVALRGQPCSHAHRTQAWFHAQWEGATTDDRPTPGMRGCRGSSRWGLQLGAGSSASPALPVCFLPPSVLSWVQHTDPGVPAFLFKWETVSRWASVSSSAEWSGGNSQARGGRKLA